MSSQFDGELLAIRRRRRLTFLAIPATFLCFLVAGVATLALRLKTNILVGATVVGGMCTIFVLSLSWVTSRCPRCHRPFFRRGFYGNPYSSKCLNCGLSLLSSMPADARRRLRRWLRRTTRTGPLPDVGLTCSKCGYLLTGLVERRCPECGTRFGIEEIVEKTRDTDKGLL
jgi:predicted Zn-ribbon and HTH transcriptional regulator